jgi:hypothetical protein
MLLVVLPVHLQPHRRQLAITRPVGQQPARNTLDGRRQAGTPARSTAQRAANCQLLILPNLLVSRTHMRVKGSNSKILAQSCMQTKQGPSADL